MEMRGFGGRYYWGRRDRRREGIVVVFAWMSSQERLVKSYVDLYSSLGWNSLICPSQFLNMFFSEKAESFALDILEEIIEELKIRSCPLIFASFSGGPKACLYKVLQIVEGKCKIHLNLDDCRLVRDCIAGYIYDSSPMDFTSDLGRRFLVHPPRILSWMVNGIRSGLDALFLNWFESQRAEYWQTLYASVSMQAPYLILCSENDELASYEVICTFAQRLRELGGDVKLVTMNGSPHVGHFQHYPIDYKAAVTELLGKASAVYSQRIQRRVGEGMNAEEIHDEMSEMMSDLGKAAANPSWSGVPIKSSDHFSIPSSVGYYDGRYAGSLQDEQKEGSIQLPGPLKINPHGVLGQILFDVCVPKNVEDWDIRSSSTCSSKQPHSWNPRRVPCNPIKCIRRSRL